MRSCFGVHISTLNRLKDPISGYDAFPLQNRDSKKLHSELQH